MFLSLVCPALKMVVLVLFTFKSYKQVLTRKRNIITHLQARRKREHCLLDSEYWKLGFMGVFTGWLTEGRIDRWTNRWMNGQTYKRTQTDGWTDKQADKQEGAGHEGKWMDRRIDSQAGRRTDGPVDGWRNWQTDRGKDERTDEQNENLGDVASLQVKLVDKQA
jgi:hypothetical protein